MAAFSGFSGSAFFLPVFYVKKGGTTIVSSLKADEFCFRGFFSCEERKSEDAEKGQKKSVSENG